MSRLRLHPEEHLVARIGWLRAAVLGANDGIVSTASLIVGVAAAAATQNDVLIAGVAGLVAGGMSMAAGCRLARNPTQSRRTWRANARS
jgi:VIT1/CCC1 family predicted Fe2+/Mn2+ transporter